MSPTRRVLFLDLADRFPSPVRERLRLAVIAGEPVEFAEEVFQFDRRLLASIGGVPIASVVLEQEREAVCV